MLHTSPLSTLAADTFSWMVYNYQEYLASSDLVDTKALAKAAATELNVEQWLADDVARAVVRDIDSPLRVEVIRLRRLVNAL